MARLPTGSLAPVFVLALALTFLLIAGLLQAAHPETRAIAMQTSITNAKHRTRRKSGPFIFQQSGFGAIFGSIGIAALAQLRADRDASQIKGVTESVYEIAQISLRDGFGTPGK